MSCSPCSRSIRLRLDADGQLHPDHVMQEAAQSMLCGLHRMGRVLGPLRETAEAHADLATLAGGGAVLARRQVRVWLDRVTAAVFLGFGLRLAADTAAR